MVNNKEGDPESDLGLCESLIHAKFHILAYNLSHGYSESDHGLCESLIHAKFHILAHNLSHGYSTRVGLRGLQKL